MRLGRRWASMSDGCPFSGFPGRSRSAPAAGFLCSVRWMQLLSDDPGTFEIEPDRRGHAVFPFQHWRWQLPGLSTFRVPQRLSATQLTYFPNLGPYIQII